MRDVLRQVCAAEGACLCFIRSSPSCGCVKRHQDQRQRPKEGALYKESSLYTTQVEVILGVSARQEVCWKRLQNGRGQADLGLPRPDPSKALGSSTWLGGNEGKPASPWLEPVTETGNETTSRPGAEEVQEVWMQMTACLFCWTVTLPLQGNP